jgi:hypothetical protein
MSNQRTFIPEEYVDEGAPEGRADIQDWIEVRDDGCFLKAPADVEWPARPLHDGEIVSFTTYVDHGSTYGTIRDGKLMVDAPMPEKATHVTADGDSDTLSSSIAELETTLNECDYFEFSETVSIQYYAWPCFAFRFDAVNKAFFRCEEPDEKALQ